MGGLLLYWGEFVETPGGGDDDDDDDDYQQQFSGDDDQGDEGILAPPNDQHETGGGAGSSSGKSTNINESLQREIAELKRKEGIPGSSSGLLFINTVGCVGG